MNQNESGRPPLGSEELRAVLGTVLDGVDQSAAAPGPGFRLVGTAAALAQGVRLTTSDVDILLARRDDVDTFAAALVGFPCRASPTWLAEARQYFARFDVDGVGVELSTVEQPVHTDTSECAGPGPWRH